jgi:hypothetical protein
MAQGNGIIVSDRPRGVFMEGYINDTSKPGTVVMIDVSEGLGNDGRPDWEAYDAAYDAQRKMIAILLENELSGDDATTAYVTGERCFVYVPVAGEEFNMLVLNLSGTADDHAFGDIFTIDDGTGKLIAPPLVSGTSETEFEPFQLLEVITDPVADTLAHVIYTGY